jgi:hypothetical protein
MDDRTMVNILYGDKFERIVGVIVQSAWAAGGRAENWRDAYHRVSGMIWFIEDDLKSPAFSIMNGKILHHLHRLWNDDEERSRFMESYGRSMGRLAEE